VDLLLTRILTPRTYLHLSLAARKIPQLRGFQHPTWTEIVSIGCAEDDRDL